VDVVDDFLGDLAAAVVTVSSFLSSFCPNLSSLLCSCDLQKAAFSLHFSLIYPLCSALVTCKCGKETFLAIPDKVFSASLYFKSLQSPYGLPCLS